MEHLLNSPKFSLPPGQSDFAKFLLCQHLKIITSGDISIGKEFSSYVHLSSGITKPEPAWARALILKWFLELKIYKHYYELLVYKGLPSLVHVVQIKSHIAASYMYQVVWP